MKKFISMVMAAAMVVSLVPATAFAASGNVEADYVQVVDTIDLVEDKDVTLVKGVDAPAVSFKIDDAEAAADGGVIKQEVTVKLDGAKFVVPTTKDGKTVYVKVEDADFNDNGKHLDDVKSTVEGWWSGLDKTATVGETTVKVTATLTKITNTKATFEFAGVEAAWQKLVADDDAIKFALQSELNKDNAGAQAKVTVTSEIAGLEITEKVYAAVEGSGIEVELEDEVVDVAVEEKVVLEDVVIEPAVGDTFAAVIDGADQLKLKLSKGFEFVDNSKEEDAAKWIYTLPNGTTGSYTIASSEYVEDDEIVIEFGATGNLSKAAEITFEGLEIVAEDAKAGDEATLTVKLADNDSVKLVVAKVIEAGLSFSVDEDEDVPVMWSGVRADNHGLTADTDEHVSLEMTIKEAFAESYSDKDEFELTLPEGVYVTNVKLTDNEGSSTDGKINTAFANAYREGDHKSFVFEKDALTESKVESDNAMEFSFEFTLVADPGFVGDVEVEMLVEGESVGKAVIAKFETPMIVEAEQNDLKIDYRNTAVPTAIVVKEAEAGLWDADVMEVALALDHGIDFEDDATFTVNEESEMEIDDTTGAIDVDDDDKVDFYALSFEVDKESDEEPAVITISDIELYMGRSLAAGAYDLEMVYNPAIAAYKAASLFAPDCKAETCNGAACEDKTNDCIIDDVTDMSDVVKEAWVNIVTAGREQDDASFTTKVVVPVGESYIVAGENTIALDVPAYVSAAGYTMLPVRAVATALGINNNNVLWDQATKTVTILYGQRIITMTVGAKVINVNGSAIPASASVEVVNGRTFLPMRDLATALGVTDITWDAATKTATLNGNI